MISLTRTTVYDVELDVDIECDRVDQVNSEEVLAYVPVKADNRDIIIRTLNQMANAIDEGHFTDSDSGTTNPAPVSEADKAG